MSTQHRTMRSKAQYNYAIEKYTNRKITQCKLHAGM